MSTPSGPAVPNNADLPHDALRVLPPTRPNVCNIGPAEVRRTFSIWTKALKWWVIDRDSGGSELLLEIGGDLKRLGYALLASLAGAGCGEPNTESNQPQHGIAAAKSALLTIDVRKSLAITDRAILAPFSLQRVMDQIVSTSGVSITGEELFRQWWDTQNKAPGLGLGPHCDDQVTSHGPSFNGYPWECPRREGNVASDSGFFNPLDPTEGFVPIGLFNRFDLAPLDGSNCGEYRIAFGRNSGNQSPQNRALMIFEAVMPNPNPSSGLEGCRPIIEFWADLSMPTKSVFQRRNELEDFYFNGISGFPAVVHYSHYGAKLGPNGFGSVLGGQIRTNQFMGPIPDQTWNLREFRVVSDCRCGIQCGIVIVPATVKENPHGLFLLVGNHPYAPNFQAQSSLSSPA